MSAWRAAKLPLKTAVAAAGAFIAYRTLHLPHGYWAPISAIIVMQSNLGRSLSESTNRIIGTAIGAITGALFTRLLGVNALSLAAAVAVTALFCTALRLTASMRLACVTASIVLLINEGSAWRSGLNRFIDVLLGVVIALLVSLAWPARARNDLRRSLSDTVRALQQLFLAIMTCCVGDPCDREAIDHQRSRAYQLARINADLLGDVARERSQDGVLLASIQQSVTRVRDHLLGMDYSARSMTHDRLAASLTPMLKNLSTDIDAAFADLAADIADDVHEPLPPGLKASLQLLDDEFDRLRAAGVFRTYGSDELLRFYSLLYRLRQLVSELERCADFANALDHSAISSTRIHSEAGYNEHTPS
jgi:uncharacterized membrane protein YccC